jgi:hypothetical protein
MVSAPAAAQGQHRANEREPVGIDRIGEARRSAILNDVVLGAAVDGSGISVLQENGIVARVASHADEAGPNEDRVVAGQGDDRARAGIAALVQRVRAGGAGYIICHRFPPRVL